MSAASVNGQRAAKIHEFRHPGRRNFAKIVRAQQQPANQALEPGGGGIAADDVEDRSRADGLGEVAAVGLKIVERFRVAKFRMYEREQIVKRDGAQKRKKRRRLGEMGCAFAGLHAVESRGRAF